MELVLVMFRAHGERRSFSVTREITIIGRREDCDLRIPVSEVSRKHCRILKDGEEVRVEDLGSSNGTYHNGQRIQGSIVAQPGDSIEVGPVVFVVQVNGMPPEDELTPYKAETTHPSKPEADVADPDFGDLGEGTGHPAAHSGSFAAAAVELSPEESNAGTGPAMPADGEGATLDLDLLEDHGGPTLSEDELLLDLNEEREKH